MISGAEVVLGPGEHVLGRSVECAVCVDDPLTSRRHAAITVTGDQVTLRDLGSRNGVMVNGEEIDQVRVLAAGDRIMLGSQALMVLQIGRGGAQTGSAVSSGKRAACASAPLAKIAIKRQAVPKAVADALAAATTVGHELSRSGGPASALQPIADAASRVIAAGRPEQAEAILEAPLMEVLATLRTGFDVENEVVELAVQQALALCEITHQQRWVDYVHDMYDQLRMPMPLPVARRLALVADKVK